MYIILMQNICGRINTNYYDHKTCDIIQPIKWINVSEPPKYFTMYCVLTVYILDPLEHTEWLMFQGLWLTYMFCMF
jgi:hypothetical protein